MIDIGNRLIAMEPSFFGGYSQIGNGYLFSGQYEKAIEQFELFRNSAKKKELELFEMLAKKYIKECNSSVDVLSQTHRIWVDNLSLNTEYDDWSPCLSADGDLLLFTSNRPNENSANNIGSYDQDIYYSNKKSKR